MQTAKKRAEKLQKILIKLENGENVQNRMLKTWLTEEEYNDFLNSWEDQKLIREELKEKPHEIIKYEKKLKKSLFIYSKAESYSYKKHKQTAKKFYNEAETHFENLLIYLQEIIHSDPMLETWFDRPTNWDIDSDLGTDIDSVPRVVTSRSLQCKAEYHLKFSKNEIKQRTVSSALNKLQNIQTDKDNEVLSIKFKKLQSKIKG